MRNYFFDEIKKSTLKKVAKGAARTAEELLRSGDYSSETTVSGDISSTETPLKKKNGDEDNDEEEEINE